MVKNIESDVHVQMYHRAKKGTQLGESSEQRTVRLRGSRALEAAAGGGGSYRGPSDT